MVYGAHGVHGQLCTRVGAWHGSRPCGASCDRGGGGVELGGLGHGCAIGGSDGNVALGGYPLRLDCVGRISVETGGRCTMRHLAVAPPQELFRPLCFTMHAARLEPSPSPTAPVTTSAGAKPADGRSCSPLTRGGGAGEVHSQMASLVPCIVWLHPIEWAIVQESKDSSQAPVHARPIAAQ